MYNYDRNLVPRARELRTEATKQEKHLWYDFLSTYPVRCHRQKIIGGAQRAPLVHEGGGPQGRGEHKKGERNP